MSAVLAQAAPSSRRVPLTDKWQTHLKFAGRAPVTLEELAIARADYEHKRRLAEIKGLKAKFAQLDELLPALAARGIQLQHREICTWDQGKTVRMHEVGSMSDDKLAAALLELGFREVERYTKMLHTDQVTLKHGRSLLVRLDVSKVQVAEPAGSPA